VTGVKRILVVDDEPQIRRTLATNLRARGIEVDLAASGEEALDLAAARPVDLVLLDLGLPGIDGVAVIRELRRTTDVPIVVLSVRDLELDKVRALDAGADDYVTKPFGIEELLARVRAALRRRGGAPEIRVVDTDHLHIDLDRSVVLVDGAPVHLTRLEWRIVDVLVSSAGRLVSQKDLLQQVWGPQYATETNYLRVYMTQLRRKLELDPSRPRHFITETGMGYRFVT
jgi:two-component system, OmpR family, KDP operon response regulator KdpE